MAFNPFSEKGIPIDKQLRNWSELNIKPYHKKEVHPYTRARIILMNGIEVEAAIFMHQFARHLYDPEMKKQLAMTRRVEQQQQKAINWLSPGDETPLETTIGYEQVAVDLTAFLAKREPDPYVKRAFDFGLLEDFDHLYRYANLLDLMQGEKAETLLGRFTEVTPGRPTINEHRHPFDDVRNSCDRTKADPLTMLQIMTLVAGEQQTMNYYMNVGNQFPDEVSRGLYLEIGQIEEQHVTQYESLMDPSASWLEMALLHEYNECYLYHSFMESEQNPQVKKIWELHLAMELEHLHIAAEMIKRHEDRDPQQLVPTQLPEPLLFEPQIDYVRQVLAEQMDWNANGTEIGPVEQIGSSRFYGMYQESVNSGGMVPSQEIINRTISSRGSDYRFEKAGAHPIERFRTRDRAVR